MKILFLLPSGTKETSGNAVTAKRLFQGIHSQERQITIIEAHEATEEILKQYDLIHCFHTYKTLLPIRSMLETTKTPWVLSFTGTDLETLKNHNQQKKETIGFINRSHKIFVFHQEAKNQVLDMGINKAAVTVIRQATMVDEQESTIDFRKQWNIDGQEILFLYAGGIRRVKGPLEAITLLRSVVDSPLNNHRIRLVMLGSILEGDTGEELLLSLKDTSWGKYMGEIPHHQMSSAIKAADIIINTSVSEGMPNTIIEAMGLKKPILASDIEGNRSLLQQGVNGFLYRNKGEFMDYALQLISNPTLRQQMGEAGGSGIRQYTVEKEVKRYIEVYDEIMVK